MSDKALIIDTPDAIRSFRLKTLLRGMQLEKTGLKLSRGASCLSIVKREFGFKGNRDKVIASLTNLMEG